MNPQSSGNSVPVLALYDFRGKQEYIYRTNCLQEISGASKLIEDIYDDFIAELNMTVKAEYADVSFRYEGLTDEKGTELPFSIDSFMSTAEILGQVLYSGGGSLMMIYKNEEVLKEANMLFSRLVIDKTRSLSLIAAHIPFDPEADFRELRTALYKKLSICKSEIIPYSPCNVTPVSQVDAITHQPIAYKTDRELSEESRLKLKKYEADFDYNTKLLDKAVTDKGEESLLAIVYIDGNNMGQKLKNCLDGSEPDIDSCVRALRKFSLETNSAYVDKPYEAIGEWVNANASKWLSSGKNEWVYRRVIGGGDEITFICNARFALKLVQVYFDNLGEGNTACAGIAVFHSHAPFAVIYGIAEECCESAKKKSREKDGSYIDFYFCRSGVTNDLDTIRGKEEKNATGLPYEVDSFFENINGRIKPIFDAIGRANAKSLTSAIISDTPDDRNANYRLEKSRLFSYAKTDISRYFRCEDEQAEDHLRRLLFDTGNFYDIWFAKKQIYGTAKGDEEK